MALIEGLKNLFGKKQQQAQPAPAPQPAPVPAPQPTPVPQPPAQPAKGAASPSAPAKKQTTGSDICAVLDSVSQDILTMNFEDPQRTYAAQQIGQALQDIGRGYISAGPCCYEGLDDLIVTTTREFPSLCKGCRPRELEQMLDSLKKAIEARELPDDKTLKHAYTIQMHYYTIKLIELQGRLITSRAQVADLDRQIAEMKVSDSPADEVALPVVRLQRKSKENELEQIDNEITTAKLRLKTAKRKKDENAPLEHLSLSDALAEISAEHEESARQRAEMLRELNDLAVEVAGILEDERERHAMELAAKESLKILNQANEKVQAELGLLEAEEPVQSAELQAEPQQVQADKPAEPQYTQPIDVDYDYVFSSMNL